MNFNDLKSLISKIRDNQANFQKVAICHLVSSNGETSRISMAEALKSKNPQLSHEVSYYKSLACPVYKILKNKKIISVDSDKVKLLINLTESQKAEISEMCQGGMI